MSAGDDAAKELGSDTQSNVQPIIARFESAWTRGQQPAIEDYLPAGSHERRAVLPGLMGVDLERRIRQGQNACVEAYLGRYPELADQGDAVIDMILTERRERQARGLGRGDEDYLRRFPQFRAQLMSKFGGLPPARIEAEPRPAQLAALANVISASADRAEAATTPAPADFERHPPARWGAFLPEALHDWLRRNERIREAGGMALATGAFFVFLGFLCLVSLFTHFMPRGEQVALATAVTGIVVVIAALQLWIGFRTRLRRTWAFWAGLLLGLIETIEGFHFLLNHNFQFDGFAGIVALPLVLLVAFQFFAYLFALMAFHAYPYDSSSSAQA